ncbi:MAG: GntR family transcriptional regulator [Spirochaetota bacterium]
MPFSNATDKALKLPRQSLSQEVYEKLIEKFLKSELVPGHILNRRDIAQQLGISVAPVLEALLQLEMEGFVESIPRKGTFVKPIRQEDIYGQLMLREAVECQAARLYHGAPVKSNLENLSLLATELEQTDADSPEHWKQEIAFHARLVELSNCPALLREFKRFMRLGVFYSINRILPIAKRLERYSHRSLIDVLAEAEPDAAEQAVREHLRSGKLQLFS